LGRAKKGVPRDLVTIIHKAIEHEPERRYQKAEELAEDLRRFLADRSIQARRATLWEQMERWARRNRGVAAALAVIALLLLAGTVVSGVAAVRFGHLARDEEAARQTAEKASARERWQSYRANVAAASSAMWVQNAVAARRYLEAAPEEHRNWEWQHLYSQLDGARAVLQTDGGAVEYSADGRWLASGFRDGTVHLWDAATGREAAVLRGLPDTPIFRFGPGSLLAAASLDPGEHVQTTVVRLWDVATHRTVWTWRTVGDPRALAWSADGQFLAVAVLGAGGKPGGRVVVWDTAAGTERLSAPAASIFTDVAFRPNGGQVAYTWEVHAYLQDLAGGPHLVLEGGTISLLRLAYSPDGKRLAAGFDFPENKVRLWDTTTGKLMAVMEGHKNLVNHLAFSPDGTRLASGSLDQTVWLWDGVTGQKVATLRGHSSFVTSLAFTPDGRHLLSGSADGTLRMWDGHTGDLVAVLHGHEGSVGAAVSPDGRTIASAATDRTIRLWDTEVAARNGVLGGHKSYVYDVAFSPDNEQVASAAWDSSARLWDATTGRQTAFLEHRSPFVTSLAFSRDGRTLVTANTSIGSILWDLATSKLRSTIPEHGQTNRCHQQIALSTDGRILATSQLSVQLYDMNAKRPLAELTTKQTGVSASLQFGPCVAFSPDGAVLVTGGPDIHFWDTTTWKNLATCAGHTEDVYCVAYSAAGNLLASGAKDNTVRLWNTRTHEQLDSINVGSSVFGLAFSPDGTRLAAGCRDNSIRLIDVATCQEVAELRGHTDYVHAVAWSPDGTRLVSGSGDYTVRIWDSLSMQERARRVASPKPGGAPSPAVPNADQ
jgi:WD40 repeat protein